MTNVFYKFSIAPKLSALFLITVLLGTVFAPWLAPHSYDGQNTTNTLSPPTIDNWMGTDRLGRDLFSRILYGGRVSLFIGFSLTSIDVISNVMNHSESGCNVT